MTATVESAVRAGRPHVLGPDDWQHLKAVRLAALHDSPDSFAHSWKREQKYGERQWRELLTTSTWIELEGAGLASLRNHESKDHVGADRAGEVRYVEGVWIPADRRGTGALEKLMEQVEELARERDIAKLLLWVFKGNERAWRAYQRLGFTPTKDENGRDDVEWIFTDRGWLKEQRMGKLLRQPPAGGPAASSGLAAPGAAGRSR